MNKNNLIGQKIITKDGSTLEIVEVEDSNNLKEIVIKTSNKKMFNIYLGYKNGFIKFVDESLNEELNEYIKNENIEIQRLKDLEEERKSIVEAKRDTKDIDFQMDLISKYLPNMLSKDEIKDIISKLDDKTVPSVMKHFKANYNGRVDMKEVSQILKEFN